jgi:hypothetical protein
VGVVSACWKRVYVCEQTTTTTTITAKVRNTLHVVYTCLLFRLAQHRQQRRYVLAVNKNDTDDKNNKDTINLFTP